MGELRYLPNALARRDQALTQSCGLCADIHARLPGLRAAAPHNAKVHATVNFLDERLTRIAALTSRQGIAGCDLAQRQRLETALAEFIALRERLPGLRYHAVHNPAMLRLVDFLEKRLCEIQHHVASGWAANEQVDHAGDIAPNEEVPA